MNDAELTQYEIDQENYQAKLAEAEAKAAQRQAILDRLGLTADEAQLLLGGN
jgi:multidrug resistance efflux pump